jgi:phytoene dehydrogenase-like protein
MPRECDVIVIGGGHNGLVAAGLLAKAGRRVILLERRSQVGGAAVTETPWGPKYKVTALSYVVSLMPPTVVRELELEKHGYKVYPQHGYFAPFADGRSLQLPEEITRRQREIAKFSQRDADRLPEWDAFLGRLGHIMGPLLSVVPPRVGSKKVKDLFAQAGLAWRLRGLNVEDVGDMTRLMMMSVADILDDFFESPELKGVMSVSGVIGTWAGPRSPGTAFVMAHHKIGDVGDGQIGSWGFPEGGMGGVTQAMSRAAQHFGAQVLTEASVEKILVKDGRVAGVALQNGDEISAPIVISTTHPKITFLRHLDREVLPDNFVQAIERWKTRSGTVKINLAVDKLPEFKARPGYDPEVHGGTIVLAESVDDIEGAFQDAVAGRPAQKPFADICIPSVFDPTLAPPGHHIVSMFTQWVPHSYNLAPRKEELDAYADRVIARVEAVAPGFTKSILHRMVIGPYQMEHEYGLIGGNIFHGELSPQQVFHMRPAPGYADFQTPIKGLYNASSASHGGGGVTAIPALQVVRKVAGSFN